MKSVRVGRPVQGQEEKGLIPLTRGAPRGGTFPVGVCDLRPTRRWKHEENSAASGDHNNMIAAHRGLKHVSDPSTTLLRTVPRLSVARVADQSLLHPSTFAWQDGRRPVRYRASASPFPSRLLGQGTGEMSRGGWSARAHAALHIAISHRDRTPPLTAADGRRRDAPWGSTRPAARRPWVSPN